MHLHAYPGWPEANGLAEDLDDSQVTIAVKDHPSSRQINRASLPRGKASVPVWLQGPRFPLALHQLLATTPAADDRMFWSGNAALSRQLVAEARSRPGGRTQSWLPNDCRARPPRPSRRRSRRSLPGRLKPSHRRRNIAVPARSGRPSRPAHRGLRPPVAHRSWRPVHDDQYPSRRGEYPKWREARRERRGNPAAIDPQTAVGLHHDHLRGRTNARPLRAIYAGWAASAPGRSKRLSVRPDELRLCGRNGARAERAEICTFVSSWVLGSRL